MSINIRHAHLFRNGRNQALRIPREFEFSEDEVTIQKKGNRLIIEPVVKRNKLAKLLASWKPLNEEFPEIKDLPPDEIDLDV